MSERSTSGMSWLNVSAPIAPSVAAAATTRREFSGLTRAASARVTSMNPNAPAAVSRIVSVGCSRNDSSVVPTRVVSIDNSDQA